MTGSCWMMSKNAESRSTSCRLARQRGGEVEAEPVDVHLGHPVPEGVHQELEDVGVPHVQGVAGARVVDVVARVLGIEAVVGGIVDALERQRGAEVVPLRRVVVDDVEQHLDTRGVERLHQLLELLHLLAERAARRVLVVGREVADRVVAPVVPQPPLDQLLVVDELVHRLQLDGGHLQRLEVVDHLGHGEAGVGAPQLGRHGRVARGEALHVHLVDGRHVPGRLGVPVVAPVEERADHDVLRHGGRAVRAAGSRLVALVAEERPAPADHAVDRLAVRVE